MTKGALVKAVELREIIFTTECELAKLKGLEVREKKEDRYYDDGLYTLCVSEHGDGGGASADLVRYEGNAKLLEVIIATLTRQLKRL